MCDDLIWKTYPFFRKTQLFPETMRAGQCVPHSSPKRILGQLGKEEIRGEKMVSGQGIQGPSEEQEV